MELCAVFVTKMARVEVCIEGNSTHGTTIIINYTFKYYASN